MFNKIKKNRIFRIIIKVKIVFVLLIFILCASVYHFENPIDIRDKLINLNLEFNGIKILKKEGLEYAHFNNCKPGKNCRCKVIVHGLGDNFQNWWQVLKKIKTADRVEGDWIAFNYPGTGNSDPFPSKGDFRVNKFAKIINSRIKKICKGPIDVIAGSMGTWISFWWVIQFPESINSLLFLNAVGAYADYSYMRDAMVNPTMEKLRDLHKKAYHYDTWYPEQVYKNTLNNILKRQNKQFILSQDKTLAVDKFLPYINKKTFIVWGKSDEILPIDTYDTYLKKMPNVQGKILENCGHVPNSECPDKVVSVINKFYK